MSMSTSMSINTCILMTSQDVEAFKKERTEISSSGIGLLEKVNDSNIAIHQPVISRGP